MVCLGLFNRWFGFTLITFFGALVGCYFVLVAGVVFSFGYACFLLLKFIVFIS